MITQSVLYGKKIYLRQAEMTDCTERYVDWLNDPEVNQYLETRWSDQNLESIKTFVKSQRENDHSLLFAIVLMENNLHIGNIKIGPINSHYNHADISYFIGEKDQWHKGIATEAIQLICQFGFEQLLLHRIEAGAYEAAVGSWRALEKCGFVREGVFRQQVRLNGNYMNVYRYGLLKDEWQSGVIKGESAI
ncbi:MAG: GNAT family N-acetyltransferase [Lachnospiraceae bacterium]|nr:GNAT family N-acetyltransferase [Lachnospiraceae bacterium]